MNEDKILNALLAQIGEKLEDMRKKAGYNSYETFAVDNDLNRIQYWRMEKGKANLTLGSLIKVLVIHKLTVPEFFSSLLPETGRKKKSS